MRNTIFKRDGHHAHLLVAIVVLGASIVVVGLGLLAGCDDENPCDPTRTGTVMVEVVPDTLGANWVLAGPADFLLHGVGDASLPGVVTGDYTLTWQEVAGWTAPDPNPATKTVVANQTVVFLGTYEEELPVEATFVTIPPGTFLMGAPADEPGSQDNEYPQHQVTLTRGFIIQATEVTNQQYLELAQWAYDNGYVATTESALLDNLDGSTVELMDLDDFDFCEIEFDRGLFRLRNVGHGFNPNHPVKEVTWHGAAAYCDWLSLQAGLPRTYDHMDWSCNGGDPYGAEGYRLPTEAEWEYACRAGTTTAFANGEITNPDTCDDPVLDEIGWYCGNSGEWTEPVAQLIPNAWGLYDMHGNLFKWCQGYMHAYPTAPVTDPAVETGRYRVVRGGAWSRTPHYSRSAHRFPRELDYAGPKQGFRPVKTVGR